MENMKSLFIILFVSGVLFSQTTPLTLSTTVFLEEEIKDIGGMCSLGCGISWDISATSHLPEQKGNTYAASNMSDGLISTAWVEGVKGIGVGEKIKFDFGTKYFESNGEIDSINLNGFRILNGYSKSEELWRNNGRVKKLKMYHNSNLIYIIEIQDKMQLQEFYFPNIFLKKDDMIVFEIIEVQSGEKYSDTAITEFEPLGAH